MSEKTFHQRLEEALRLAEGSGGRRKAQADVLADQLVGNFRRNHANPGAYHKGQWERDAKVKPLKLHGKDVVPPELDKHGIQKRKR